MKIYISVKQPKDDSYNHVSNIMMLDDMVLDCEATDIIVDNYLSQFSESELPQLLSKILSKMRVNGTITIVDIDVDILSMRYNRGDVTIKDLNDLLFGGTSRKSLLNLESVATAFNDSFLIEQSSLDSQLGTFFVKARRTK
jgi:hypothetical protein